MDSLKAEYYRISNVSYILKLKNYNNNNVEFENYKCNLFYYLYFIIEDKTNSLFHPEKNLILLTDLNFFFNHLHIAATLPLNRYSKYCSLKSRRT